MIGSPSAAVSSIGAGARQARDDRARVVDGTGAAAIAVEVDVTKADLGLAAEIVGVRVEDRPAGPRRTAAGRRRASSTTNSIFCRSRRRTTVVVAVEPERQRLAVVDLVAHVARRRGRRARRASAGAATSRANPSAMCCDVAGGHDDAVRLRSRLRTPRAARRSERSSAPSTRKWSEGLAQESPQHRSRQDFGVYQIGEV